MNENIVLKRLEQRDSVAVKNVSLGNDSGLDIKIRSKINGKRASEAIAEASVALKKDKRRIKEKLFFLY